MGCLPHSPPRGAEEESSRPGERAGGTLMGAGPCSSAGSGNSGGGGPGGFSLPAASLRARGVARLSSVASPPPRPLPPPVSSVRVPLPASGLRPCCSLRQESHPPPPSRQLLLGGSRLKRPSHRGPPDLMSLGPLMLASPVDQDPPLPPPSAWGSPRGPELPMATVSEPASVCV